MGQTIGLVMPSVYNIALSCFRSFAFNQSIYDLMSFFHFVVSRLRHPPMEVKYTVDNGKRIPKRLEELTSDQRDNIVTTTFGIIVLESLNVCNS